MGSAVSLDDSSRDTTRIGTLDARGGVGTELYYSTYCGPEIVVEVALFGPFYGRISVAVGSIV